jgi:hypothetical protein
VTIFIIHGFLERQPVDVREIILVAIPNGRELVESRKIVFGAGPDARYCLDIGDPSSANNPSPNIHRDAVALGRQRYVCRRSGGSRAVDGCVCSSSGAVIGSSRFIRASCKGTDGKEQRQNDAV